MYETQDTTWMWMYTVLHFYFLAVPVQDTALARTCLMKIFLHFRYIQHSCSNETIHLTTFIKENKKITYHKTRTNTPGADGVPQMVRGVLSLIMVSVSWYLSRTFMSTRIRLKSGWKVRKYSRKVPDVAHSEAALATCRANPCGCVYGYLCVCACVYVCMCVIKISTELHPVFSHSSCGCVFKGVLFVLFRCLLFQHT